MDSARKTEARWVIPALSDPRWALFAFLCSFVAYAVFAPGFLRRPDQVLAAFATALSLDFVFGGFYGGEVRLPLSGLITACGTVLLCDSPFVYPYAVVAALAILSKHVLRIKERHIFNPLNLAMTLVLLFLPNLVIVDASRWGGSLAMLFAVAGLGLFASWRAARLDLSLAYAGVFTAGAVARAGLGGGPLAATLAPFSGAAFQLFAFFMISDPVTTPSTRSGRIAFAVCDGAADAVFRQLHIRNAPFYALFLTSGLTPLFPAIFPDQARDLVWRQKEWPLRDPWLFGLRKVRAAAIVALGMVVAGVGLRAVPGLIVTIGGPGASATGWVRSGEAYFYRKSQAALRRRGLRRSALWLARLQTLSDPGDQDAWLDRAELDAEGGDGAGASADLSRAGGRDAMRGQESLRAAAVFEQLQDDAAALTLVKRASMERPGDPDLWLETARLELRSGERAAAASALAHAGALPMREEQRRKLAFEFQDAGEYPAAERLFADLIRDQPQDALLHNDHAVCLYFLGEPDRAIQETQVAIRLQRDLLEPYLTLGYIQTSQGRTGDAIKTYEDALSLKHPSDAALLLQIRHSRDELIAR